MHQLHPEERLLCTLPSQSTLYCSCSPSWDGALLRTRHVFTMLNAGYIDPKNLHVSPVPVYKVLAINRGRHSRAKNSEMFA